MVSVYFIIEIKGITDSRFGECAAVYANPVHEMNLVYRTSRSYTPYICSETRLFFFPSDDSIIQPLVRLARSQQVWEPCLDDFKVERIFDETDGQRKEIYRHRSFFDNNYSSVVGNINPVVIPQIKFQQLDQKYTEYMRQNYMFDPIDLQVYVNRIAETDSNFFAWLFDDNSLRGYSEYDLDDEQREAWDNFYERLDPYYGND